MPPGTMVLAHPGSHKRPWPTNRLCMLPQGPEIRGGGPESVALPPEPERPHGLTVVNFVCVFHCATWWFSSPRWFPSFRRVSWFVQVSPSVTEPHRLSSAGAQTCATWGRSLKRIEGCGDFEQLALIGSSSLSCTLRPVTGPGLGDLEL